MVTRQNALRMSQRNQSIQEQDSREGWELLFLMLIIIKGLLSLSPMTTETKALENGEQLSYINTS